MHLDKFDLNLLVALDALLTEKHVTRAAEKLFVSQPAMSAALARLRAYFDDPLLQKVGPSLDLTPRATLLAAAVRELLFRIRSTLSSEPTFDPSCDDRQFILQMSDYVASVLMPPLTSRLLEKAPGVRVQIHPLSPDGMTRIRHGVDDFCVTARDWEIAGSVEDSDALSAAPLFDDEFVLVVDRNSEAATLDLDRESFLRLPYVAVRFTHSIVSVAESSVRQQKLPLRPSVVVPSFTAAACLIAGTPLTSFIPRRLAVLLAPALGLAVRPAPIALETLEETLVWHGRNDADPAHVWFRSILHDAARSLVDACLPVPAAIRRSVADREAA